MDCAQVTDAVEQDIKNEPRWEYSSTGQKTLDLGFGTGRQAPAQGSLTWVKLRAVSRSFTPRQSRQPPIGLLYDSLQHCVGTVGLGG